MPLPSEQANHYKTILKTCIIANTAYLILRFFYLILFLVSGLYILAWIDLATIGIYFLCFLLMKRRKYYLYALVCGNEFLVFVTVATLMAGFNTGFHFYLIGLCVVSFFTSYFSKKKNVKNPIIWAGLSVIIYLVIYFISAFNPPYYAISKWLEVTLFTTHAIVAFLFVVFYLWIFLKYALSLEKRIMNESRTDGLTQISNRYGLYDYLAQEKDRDSKALALFDIDDFKQINDAYGHVVGDFILKRVAEIASDSLSDSFLCRYGGEEFVVVMNKEGSFERLEALRKKIEAEDIKYEGATYKITITIGVADYAGENTLEKWVNRADEKMYSGKHSGKNKTVA